jgi:hypothetical protein
VNYKERRWNFSGTTNPDFFSDDIISLAANMNNLNKKF